MRIIQSFWTLPMVKSRDTTVNNRFSGGWLDVKYHLMSWAYSCLQLRVYYDVVELITDAAGKSLLIDQLRLPYTRTDIVLDDINKYNPEWWAIGKIYAFSMQETPFIHVDGDVFIWDKFPERLERGALIAQNLEHDFSFYRKVMEVLLENNSYIPPAILNNYQQGLYLDAYNAGVIGGNNIAFFQEYVKEVFQFIRKNHLSLRNVLSGMVNAFYEQHLYYCMAQRWKIPVECYTHVVNQNVLNHNLKSLPQFEHAPETATYIHLFGEDAKKNIHICEVLANKLRINYPDYYYRIMDIVQTKAHTIET
jgi:menaquinone-dependent protoporphyrinogen IX oxidase